jgi:hypothetical protein
MGIKLLKSFFGVVFCMFQVSCSTIFHSPCVYQPVPVNMPLPGAKGELKINAFVTESNICGVQGAYTADSHIVAVFDGAMLNYVLPKDIQIYDGPSSLYDFVYSGDIGAGYYTRFGRHGRFEAIGGLGYGSSRFYSENNAWGLYIRYLKSQYIRAFARADAGFVYKNFEIGLGLGFNALSSEGKYMITYGNNNNLVKSSYSLNYMSPCADAHLLLAAGIKNVKLTGSIGYNGLLGGPSINAGNSSLYKGAYLSMGLTINIFGKK